MTKPKGHISQYGVFALKTKRAELAGEVAQLELQLRDRRSDLTKIDDVLRILSPGIVPEAIRTKKTIRYLNIFRQGELGQIIVGLLRDGPMTNRAIALTIMERSGISSELWIPLHRRTRANLAYLVSQSRVVKIGSNRSAMWELSRH